MDNVARVEDFVWRYVIEALKKSFTRSRDKNMVHAVVKYYSLFADDRTRR